MALMRDCSQRYPQPDRRADWAARRALFTVLAVRPAVDRPPRERANPRANAGRHRATPSDARNVTGGQGVAGSNPAVPTGSDIFRIHFYPIRANKRAIRL